MPPQLRPRFRFPRLRYLGAFLALLLVFGILPFEPAGANGGDFDLDFASATPTTYNHSTGVGGVWGDSVEQLNGGSFNCGDKVVHFVSIHVDSNPTHPAQTARINLSFDTQSSGQDGAGYRSLFSVGGQTNPPDAAHTADGDEAVNLISQDFTPIGDATPGTVTVDVTNLEANETFILRVVVVIDCDPEPASPTGVISARVTSAAVTFPAAAASTINIGNQTTPLMNPGALAPAAIEITKTADAAIVSAGDQIGFDIVVSNPGAGTANAVHVSDPLPGGAGLNWSINPAVAGCAINGAPPAQTLVCDFATLAPAGSITIQVNSATTAAQCGTINNTATVTTGNDGTDNASASVEVRCPDVTVTKTAGQPIVTENGTATFTIQVTNSGAGTADNVTLTDTLPTQGGPGLWTENPDIAACSIALGVLSCDFGDLAPGASASVTVTKQLGAGCAQIPNTATVAAANEPQSAMGNNTSNEATITVTCAELSIAKVADAPSVSAGDPVGFTITVINGGNAAANNVVITDSLPGSLGLNWTEAPDVAACGITGAIGFQVLDCTFPTIAANGGTATVHVQSPTTAATCGTITNRVGLTGEPAVASVIINCPDVQVVKTADNSPINAGEVAAFTIAVTNLGPGTATGVTLSDTLPTGIIWAENSTDCSIGGNTLTCDFGTLDVLELHTINVTGTTDGADCGQLDNTASVLSTNEPASVLANNSSTASIVVNCPDVEVEKTADDPTINAGQTAAFTIVVTNNGPGTATSVTLNDTLPAGVVWTEDSDDCTITANVLSCDFGDLGVGESRTIHLTGPTDAADCGILNNTSTIAATNEATGADGNNSATAAITVSCPPPPPDYGTDPSTLPTEQPYNPAPGGEPTGPTVDQPADPGAGTAGTTVPVTPAPESNPVVDAVIDVVQGQVSLPRTGAELIQQAIAGLALVGFGALLMALRRRRSSSDAA